MTVKIVLAGPRGKMGTEAIKMILKEQSFELVGCIDRINNGKSLNEVTHVCENSIPIYDDAENCFNELNPDVLDRKSTRLNSSHVSISYAVFCLKKKRYCSRTNHHL